MSRIKISRSAYIEESRAIADLRLQEKSFLPGELAMLSYYKSDGTIDVLMAVGISEGQGDDHYRLISGGSSIVKVREVSSDLPDVSKLVHGELYVYQDPDNVWNYVYQEEGKANRIITPIDGGPYIFVSLEDGYRWFYKDQDCKREDDFFSSAKLTDILASLSDCDIEPTITSETGYVIKAGEVKDVVLSVGARNKVSGTDISRDCLYYVDGVLVEPNEEGQIIVSSVSGDKDIFVTIRYPIEQGIYTTATETIKIRAGYKFYYGAVSDDWEIGKEAIESLDNVINYRRSWNWDDIILSYQRIVVAYPKKYGYLAHIYDDNGLDYIRTYQPYLPGLSWDGEEYIVYIKKDSVSVGDFLQNFTFNDTDSIELSENNLFDLIDAWKNRGTRSGLVVLDEDGRISGDLVGDLESGTIKTLTGMVSEFPTSDMTVGDIYYNTETGELFTAITEYTGVVSKPESDQLYYYDGNFYSLSRDSLQKFSRIETKEINTIKEIYG